MEKINPRVDLVFKKIFGVEENKDLTISLINSIVSEEDQVEEITLLNPYNAQTFLQDKCSVLDIKAKGTHGRLFNIEIQVADEADYDKRALYYWAKLYTEQLKTGQDYGQLCKAIGIHILNFISIPEAKKYHNVFRMKEQDSHLSCFKDIELHTIELSRFEQNLPLELQGFVGNLKTGLDLWAGFLTRHNLINGENLPQEKETAPIHKALSVLDVMALAKEERDSYENRLKWLRIETNALKKFGHDKFLEGKQAGLKEGKQAGLKEGAAAERKRVAQALLQQGLPHTAIAQVTGLTEEVIRRLQEV